MCLTSSRAATCLQPPPSRTSPTPANLPAPQSLGCPVRELFLLVPAISRWQWHPISVAGAQPDASGRGSVLTLHIKRYGRWTAELLRLLKHPRPLALRVSGTPHGIKLSSMHSWEQAAAADQLMSTLLQVAAQVFTCPAFTSCCFPH